MRCITCNVMVSSPAFCGKCHPKRPSEVYRKGRAIATNGSFATYTEAEEYLSANRSLFTLKLVSRYMNENGYKHWGRNVLQTKTYRPLCVWALCNAKHGDVTLVMSRVPQRILTRMKTLGIIDMYKGPLREDETRDSRFAISWNAFGEIAEVLKEEFPFYSFADVLLEWEKKEELLASTPDCCILFGGVYTSLAFIHRGYFYVGQYFRYKGDVYASQKLFNGASLDGAQKWGFGLAYSAPNTIENLSIIIESHQPFDVKIEACAELWRVIQLKNAVAKSFIHRMSVETYNNQSMHRYVYDEVKVAGPDMNGFAYSMVPRTKKTPILEEWENYLNFYKPYSQQKIMAELIYNARFIPLWVDMRVGKTNAAIMAARRLLEEKKIEKVVIVCPAMLMYSPWDSELEKQGCFSVCILDGSRDECEAEIEAEECDFYIVSYSSLGSRLKMMQEHWDMEQLMWIGDETSSIKSPRSKRSKAVMCATKGAAAVVALNGTPISQGAQDVWSQQFFVDQGATFGRSFGGFSKKWLQKVSATRSVIKREERLAFEVELAGSSYRCMRGEADQFRGRSKTFRFISFNASVEMIEEYDRILGGWTIDGGGEEVSVKDNILTVYGHLRECCAGYSKHETFENSGEYNKIPFKINPKVLWVRTFLKSNPGQPLVLSCESSLLEDMLMEMLEEEGVPYSSLRPKGSKTTYSKPVKAQNEKDFQEGKTRVFLLKSVQGKGITLNRVPAVKANIGTYPALIFLQPTFSLIDWEQMQDRCVGTDTKRQRSINTAVYVLTIAGSIEEKIVKALRGKKNVSDELLQDAERNGYENPFKEMKLGGGTLGDEVFDVEEMNARYVLGIGPQQRISEKMIRAKDKRYLSRLLKVTQKSVTELSEYGEILMEKIK